MLNNRELSAVVWLAIIIVIASRFTSPVPLVKALFRLVISKPALFTFGGISIYAAACVWLLQRYGFWSTYNLKTTIFWLGGFAFAVPFRLQKIERNGEAHFFSALARESIGISLLVGFLASAYVFSFPTEFVLTGVVGALSIFAVVAERTRGAAFLGTFATFSIAIVGLAMMASALKHIFSRPGEFATAENGLEFALPAILSVMFVPYAYLLHVHNAYARAVARLRISIKNESLRRFAQYRMASFWWDIDGLEKWLKHIALFTPNSEKEVLASVSEIKRRRKRERRPFRVPPGIGWAPDQATFFLKAEGLGIRDYHRSIDGWYGCSNYLRLGAGVFSGSIAFYIEGQEYAVTKLKLVLTVDDVEHAEGGEERFEKLASLLASKACFKYGQADSSHTLKVGQGPLMVAGKKIVLEREDLENITGGYELSLTIAIDAEGSE